MAYRSLTLTSRGSVALLSLNRPRRRNRIDAAMAQELREACLLLEQDDAVRVVLLAGRGADFCAGSVLDRRSLPTRDTAALGERLERHRVADAIASIGKPVVSALQGAILGQGLELALACDLRIAQRGAQFALPQVVWGAIPWDGGTQRLSRLIGSARALEMLLLGRQLDADEALALGLVHQVADDALADARALAQELAQRAPIAARYAKEALRQGMDSNLAQGLRLEADLNILLHTSRDRARGIASFLGRKTPRYTGR